MDQRPKCKSSTIELLEGNINEYLSTFGLDNTFLQVTPKEKIGKLDVTKIQKIFASKDTIKIIKKTTHRMGENINKARQMRD